MSENKTIEQAAAEFVDKEMCYRGLKLLVVRQASIKSYVAGAKHQKELSDAREKLLMDVISEQQESLRFAISIEPDGYNAKLFIGWKKLHETYSSVAKKLEGL